MTATSNIAGWVTDRAATDPDLPAIKQGDTIWTYGALDESAARFATVLASHGVGPGDRVALIMPNVGYFPIAYYAILRLGAVVVPMNPLLKAGEVAYAWQDSEAKVAVVFPLFAEEARKAASVTGVDVVVTTPVTSRPCSPHTSRPSRWPAARRRTPRSSSTPPAPPVSPRVPSSPMPMSAAMC